MRYKPAVAALATLTAMTAHPTPALAETYIGIGGGGNMVMPQAGSGATSAPVQPNYAVKVQVVEEFLELSLGTMSRDLVDAAGAGYGIQASGLTLGMGLRMWNIRFGYQAEGTLLRNVTAPATGGIQVRQGFGYIGEAYAALQLTRFADVTAYMPLQRPDPVIGPRVMITLWVPAGDD